jgi:hypothetical protein
LAVDSNGVRRNFNDGVNGALRLLFPVASLVIKLVALGLDRWTTVVMEVPMVGHSQTTDWGLVRYRQRGTSEGAMTYADSCKREEGGSLTECRTLRAGGAFTLLAAIFAVLSSLILIALTLGARRSLENLSARAMRMWRWAYRAQLAAAATFS